VSTLEVVEDVGLNAAVTPVGMPDAANATLPVNGLTSVTVIVSVPLLPATTVSAVADGFSVKVPVAGTTVSVMGTVAVLLPEVPVMVTVYAPAVTVLPTVSVRTVEVAEDVGLNEEVTPLGRPDMLNDTVPVNPGRSVTVMVSVPLVPWVTERLLDDAARVKPVAGMVMVMVTDSVIVPLVPTILIG
jgi:hypothetical protein